MGGGGEARSMVACFASNSLWVLVCGVDLCCVSWGCVEDGGVGILPAGSPRYTPRRVVEGRDSPRSERDGARNTKI